MFLRNYYKLQEGMIKKIKIWEMRGKVRKKTGNFQK